MKPSEPGPEGAVRPPVNEFMPDPRGIITNPFYIARHGLHRALAGLLPRCSGRLLDIGCGTKPYRRLAPGVSEYIGLEVDTAEARRRGGADVYYDGGRLPFPDHSFDAVLCSQVFEHIFAPEAFLAELSRVLRPGGCLIMTVPFMWDEHEQPVDFARYSSFGLRAVVTKAGFHVEIQEKTWPNGAALAQMHAGWLYKKTRGLSRPLRALMQLLLIAPVTVAGLLAARILPDNPDLFLDNILLARKPRQ